MGTHPAPTSKPAASIAPLTKTCPQCRARHNNTDPAGTCSSCAGFTRGLRRAAELSEVRDYRDTEPGHLARFLRTVADRYEAGHA